MCYMTAVELIDRIGSLVERALDPSLGDITDMVREDCLEEMALLLCANSLGTIDGSWVYEHGTIPDQTTWIWAHEALERKESE